MDNLIIEFLGVSLFIYYYKNLPETSFNLKPHKNKKIKKVKLYEVSVVTFPAYTDTSVQARKEDYAAIKKRSLENWKNGILKKLEGVK